MYYFVIYFIFGLGLRLAVGLIGMLWMACGVFVVLFGRLLGLLLSVEFGVCCNFVYYVLLGWFGLVCYLLLGASGLDCDVLLLVRCLLVYVMVFDVV